MISDENCAYCHIWETPLPACEAAELALNVPNWTLLHAKIEREFKFRDLPEAVAFVNLVADIAHKQGHIPDIFISYERVVRLTLSTHRIGGLWRNDFILAHKIDRLAENAVLTKEAEPTMVTDTASSEDPS